MKSDTPDVRRIFRRPLFSVLNWHMIREDFFNLNHTHIADGFLLILFLFGANIFPLYLQRL